MHSPLWTVRYRSLKLCDTVDSVAESISSVRSETNKEEACGNAGAAHLFNTSCFYLMGTLRWRHVLLPIACVWYGGLWRIAAHTEDPL